MAESQDPEDPIFGETRVDEPCGLVGRSAGCSQAVGKAGALAGPAQGFTSPLHHCSSLFQDWRERVLSSLELSPLSSQSQKVADMRCLRDVCCLSKVPTTFHKAFSLLLLFLFPTIIL